jgi:hypothetical protein
MTGQETGSSAETATDIDHLGVSKSLLKIEELGEVVGGRLYLPLPIRRRTLVPAVTTGRIATPLGSMNPVRNPIAQIHPDSPCRLERQGSLIQSGSLDLSGMALATGLGTDGSELHSPTRERGKIDLTRPSLTRRATKNQSLEQKRNFNNGSQNALLRSVAR